MLTSRLTVLRHPSHPPTPACVAIRLTDHAAARLSAARLSFVTPGEGVKDTPLALDDVLFVTSNVKLQRMHDLAVSMPAGNYLPPVPGDCQPYRHASCGLFNTVCALDPAA